MTEQKLKDAYQEAETRTNAELVDDINLAQFQNDMKKAWDLIKVLSGVKYYSRPKIKAENGKERLQLWYQYFKSLLGDQESSNGSGAQGNIENEK